MVVNVFNAYKEAENYIKSVKNGCDAEAAWEAEVIAPFWDRLCCYAPFDLSERKPKPGRDIAALERECELLAGLDVDALRREFERVTAILPNYDDDPLTVVIFPGNNENTSVNERQNGVLGSALYGNLIIEVNPLVEGYEGWISYVFAHEYHHTVWGNYWYMLHGDELEHKFIESLAADGEADSFALELYPALRPEWLFGLPEAEVARLWEEKYRAVADKTDVDYVSYMFGNAELGIPWCAGYAVGYWLVQRYLKAANKGVLDIRELKPELLLG